MVAPWPPTHAPSPIDAPSTPVTRRTRAASPSPLEQIPVWDGDRRRSADARAGDRAGRRSTRCSAGSTRSSCRAVTHGDGPLLVVAGAGTGKTQVITRRIAWLIATRRARPSEILALTFTDKAADEMQVRVDQLVPYGYTDTRDLDVPRLRRPADPRVRPGARAAAGRPRPVAAGDRHLPARAPVRARAGRVPAARRPDPVPRRARDAVQRAARTRTSRPTRTSPTRERRAASGAPSRTAAGRDGRDRDAAAALAERGARARPSSPAPTGATRSSWPRTAASTSATRSRSPCASCASRRPRARTIQARFRYVLVDEFQDTNRAQSELVALLAERAPRT